MSSAGDESSARVDAARSGSDAEATIAAANALAPALLPDALMFPASQLAGPFPMATPFVPPDAFLPTMTLGSLLGPAAPLAVAALIGAATVVVAAAGARRRRPGAPRTDAATLAMLRQSIARTQALLVAERALLAELEGGPPAGPAPESVGHPPRRLLCLLAGVGLASVGLLVAGGAVLVHLAHGLPAEELMARPGIVPAACALIAGVVLAALGGRQRQGSTRIFAWASGRARVANTSGTPSTPTRPVTRGATGRRPSAMSLSVSANSSGV